MLNLFRLSSKTLPRLQNKNAETSSAFSYFIGPFLGKV